MAYVLKLSWYFIEGRVIFCMILCVIYHVKFLFDGLDNAELDALEADMGAETESDAIPSYLQPDKEPDLDAELNLPAAPTGNSAVPNRVRPQVFPSLDWY